MIGDLTIFAEKIISVISPENRAYLIERAVSDVNWWRLTTNGLILAKMDDDESWDVVLLMEGRHFSLSTEGDSLPSAGSCRRKSVPEVGWDGVVAQELKWLLEFLLGRSDLPPALREAMKGSEVVLRRLMHDD